MVLSGDSFNDGDAGGYEEKVQALREEMDHIKAEVLR